MNAKSLRLLRIGTLILGWLLLAGVYAGVWGHLAIYYRGQNDPTGLLRNIQTQFDLASALSSFFSGFGNAFLAFLVAAVFRMIEEEGPVGRANSRALMIICCLSYLADAFVRFYSVVLNLPALRSVKGFGWLLPSYASTAVAVLIPVLYAASIFVLYTHFTKMVTFESEVA